MGKKRNEVNGVLVYRRWCIGAILSMILLIVVAAPPVLLVVFKWISISGYGSGDIALRGSNLLHLVRQYLDPVLGSNGLYQDFVINSDQIAFDHLIADITSNPGVPMFGLINTSILWVLLVFLAILLILVVVDIIFTIFYLLTGRVVNPAAPVKLSWAIFVFMLLIAGASFGYTFFLNMAASGVAALKFNFLFPLIFAGGSLVTSILLSIVYVNAFKDKFYIGRAKRFGSGGTNQYQTNQYYQAPAPASQPQVIIVNGGGYPQGGQVVIPTQQQPANGEQPAPNVQVVNAPQAEEVQVAPRGVLPADIKSIGGHAFSKNLDLKYADIPSGIKELGAGAFANCLNLEIVSIPVSVKRIRKNCFFNCVKLARINFGGTKSQWRYVVRGSNWLDRAGTRTVVCSDGAIIVDPHR